MTAVKSDLDRLLKLRLVVARFGESDMSNWWSSQGVLGRYGAMTLRRGFPRTHFFAQARAVFELARHRCAEVFNPPKCVTLWQLPETVQEAFDARWETWLDNAGDWVPFFEALQAPPTNDLVQSLTTLNLVTTSDLEAYARLRRSPGGNAVQLGGSFEPDRDISLLALGFGRGERANLAVPYISRTDI
jgi:hypothetical protein